MGNKYLLCKLYIAGGNQGKDEGLPSPGIQDFIAAANTARAAVMRAQSAKGAAAYEARDA